MGQPKVNSSYQEVMPKCDSKKGASMGQITQGLNSTASAEWLSTIPLCAAALGSPPFSKEVFLV